MLRQHTLQTRHMQITLPKFEFKAIAKVIDSGSEKPGLKFSLSHLAVSRYLIPLVSSVYNLGIIIVATS